MTADDTRSVYLAIRLPDGARGRLAAIHETLTEAARDTTEQGRKVRYLNGMYIPGRHCLLCAFAAESVEAARAMAERARLPFVQIESGL